MKKVYILLVLGISLLWCTTALAGWPTPGSDDGWNSVTPPTTNQSE